MAPEIPLPPQPVLTRWGTWLSAVFYYVANITKIRETIIFFLEEEESAAVKIVHEIMQKESLRCDLVFITNFANFVLHLHFP
ncbi:hypothetical protein T07_3177 [Trichinella nelsoni]|uniref:Uncharacterized protein n=1 Tax=Trichinella nelsoni TaxID=6336 RepID=A0A0V0RUK6_9BILA|nr:hypothetical protein T07_3177 [Trichinella nelsoni]